MSISQIPHEVLSYTFSFLPYYERAVLRQVCKAFLYINKKAPKLRSQSFMNSIWRLIWAESCGLNLSKIRFELIYRKASLDVMKFIVPMITSPDRGTIFVRAVREGNLTAVRYIINSYPGIFPATFNDCKEACKSGNIDAMRLLRNRTICKIDSWECTRIVYKTECLCLSKTREMRDLILSGELD